ncbi:MAG: hypothetical protein GXP45_00445 [bacterium]|nr:hypothetical protein [bacterium]
MQGDDAVDVLTEAFPVSYKVVEGSCEVAPLDALTLQEATPTTVVAEEVKNIVEDTTDINPENIFDKAQTKTFFEENWLYLTIGVVILIALILLLKPKKKNKK